MHEAQMHEENSFVTLTYADEHLPPGGSLRLSDFQKFMKRLRSRFDARIRFFHCGEYGEDFSRPHYHALLFGLDFQSDRRHWVTRAEHPVFRSPTLEALWPWGQSEIGAVSFESAAYVARYVTKKVTGPLAEEHYTRVDKTTGELVVVEPEYATMSRRPGIGSTWLEEFHSDVYPRDHVVSRGREAKPPRFYDQWYAGRDPDRWEAIKVDRRRARKREDESPDRLSVRETCTKARVELSSKRRLEVC